MGYTKCWRRRLLTRHTPPGTTGDWKTPIDKAHQVQTRHCRCDLVLMELKMKSPTVGEEAAFVHASWSRCVPAKHGETLPPHKESKPWYSSTAQLMIEDHRYDTSSDKPASSCRLPNGRWSSEDEVPVNCEGETSIWRVYTTVRCSNQTWWNTKCCRRHFKQIDLPAGTTYDRKTPDK